MKKVIFLFIILPFLLITCKKKEEIDLSQYKGSANLLGASWQASKVDFAISAANNTLTFELFKYNESNELRQELVFSNLNISKDTIYLKYSKWLTDSIISTARFYTHLGDGHLLGDIFKILDDRTFKNWIVLNKISEDEISGKFQVAFAIEDRLYPDRKTLPDSIYFTKGEFLARRR